MTSAPTAGTPAPIVATISRARISQRMLSIAAPSWSPESWPASVRTWSPSAWSERAFASSAERFPTRLFETWSSWLVTSVRLVAISPNSVASRPERLGADDRDGVGRALEVPQAGDDLAHVVGRAEERARAAVERRREAAPRSSPASSSAVAVLSRTAEAPPALAGELVRERRDPAEGQDEQQRRDDRRRRARSPRRRSGSATGDAGAPPVPSRRGAARPPADPRWRRARTPSPSPGRSPDRHAELVAFGVGDDRPAEVAEAVLGDDRAAERDEPLDLGRPCRRRRSRCGRGS